MWRKSQKLESEELFHLDMRESRRLSIHIVMLHFHRIKREILLFGHHTRNTEASFHRTFLKKLYYMYIFCVLPLTNHVPIRHTIKVLYYGAIYRDDKTLCF